MRNGPAGIMLASVRWLLVIFIVVPLAELALLVWVGNRIGFWATVATTVVTAAIGSALARREGLKVWRTWRASLETLTAPELGIVDGVLVLVGCALLVSPGFITDVSGLLLLVPGVRRVVARHVRRALERRIASGRIRYASHRFGAPAAARHGARHSPEAVIETTGESADEPRSAPQNG